jgi:hypothetical protein
VSNVLFCFCCIAAQKVPTAKHGCGIEIELRFFALKPTSLRKHTTWLYMYERNKIHNVHLLSKRTSVNISLICMTTSEQEIQRVGAK